MKYTVYTSFLNTDYFVDEKSIQTFNIGMHINIVHIMFMSAKSF